jgi:hypothetical protein
MNPNRLNENGARGTNPDAAQKQTTKNAAEVTAAPTADPIDDFLRAKPRPAFNGKGARAKSSHTRETVPTRNEALQVVKGAAFTRREVDMVLSQGPLGLSRNEAQFLNNMRSRCRPTTDLARLLGTEDRPDLFAELCAKSTEPAPLDWTCMFTLESVARDMHLKQRDRVADYRDRCIELGLIRVEAVDAQRYRLTHLRPEQIALHAGPDVANYLVRAGKLTDTRG